MSRNFGFCPACGQKLTVTINETSYESPWDRLFIDHACHQYGLIRFVVPVVRMLDWGKMQQVEQQVQVNKDA